MLGCFSGYYEAPIAEEDSAARYPEGKPQAIEVDALVGRGDRVGDAHGELIFHNAAAADATRQQPAQRQISGLVAYIATKEMVERSPRQVAGSAGRQLDEPSAPGEKLKDVAAILDGPAVIA